MTYTNEDLLALAERLDEWREHCGYCGRYAVERNSRGQCICAACLAENNPGHWGAVHYDTSTALRAIVAERQAIRDKAMEDAVAKATTAALLEDLGNNLWNICNSINDEDWIGQPKGLTAKVVGHFEKHHRMHVEMLERAARQVAAIRAMKGKPE